MRPISGSGSSATPRPTEAIATRKSQCALWAAMAGCMPASAKAWRSRRVMAKSSVGTSSRESRRAVRGRDVLPAQAASGGPMTQIGWLPKARAARPWSGATGRTVAPTSSSPSATRCSTAWPVPSRSVRWMFGWRSRKRLTTGVNSRLIMGGMPTSSAPRRRSAVSRISSDSWRMVSSTCKPRWYITRPVSVGRAVCPSRISSCAPASSSSCRIILLTVDCVTNKARAACVKLACLTVSTK